MNPLAKLEQLNLEPTAKNAVAALIQSLIEQAEQMLRSFKPKMPSFNAKDIKIGALTHELAYYRRIRFSTKSKALAPLQHDVFEETWNTDISAIDEEVEQLRDDQPCAPSLAPNAHAPVVNPCPIICHALNTVTNPNLALVDNAVKT